MTPPFVIKYLVAFAAVAGLLFGAYRYGYNERDEKAQIEAANAIIDAEALEEVLRGEIAATRKRSQTESKNATLEIQRLRADLESGAQRLWVPAAPAGPSGDPTPGPGAPRAELDSATASALVAITADGDQAIRELNSCLQAYEAVRKTLNP